LKSSDRTEKRQDLTAQLDGIFNPKSVAIVGLPRGMKTGKLFLAALQDQGFPRDISFGAKKGPRDRG